MTEPYRPSFEPTPPNKFNPLYVIAALTIVLALGGWFAFGMGGADAPEVSKQAKQQLKNAKEQQAKAEAALVAAQAAKQQAEADRLKVAAARASQTKAVEQKASKDTQARLVADCAAALKKLQAGTETAKKWQAEVPALLTNDSGRYIAAVPNLMTRFAELYDQTEAPDTTHLEVRVSSLSKRCDQLRVLAEDDANFATPDVNFKDDIELAARTAQDYKHSYTNAVALLKAAKKAASSPATVTLAEAISNDRARRIQEAADNEAARRGEAERILQAQRDQSARDNAEAEARRARERAAFEKHQEDQTRERSQLLADAQDPATVAHFAPFLAKTGWQPMLRRDGDLECHGGHPGPLSLAVLNAGHAMTDVKRFVSAATGPCGDRPRWPEPASKDEWSQREADMHRFAKLAPVWIEKGMLRP